MTIFNETVRLFFAMTALILVGLLSAPITGDFNLLPAKVTKVSKIESKPMTKTNLEKKKKNTSKKLASLEKKKLKLRKS